MLCLEQDDARPDVVTWGEAGWEEGAHITAPNQMGRKREINKEETKKQ